MKRLVCVFTGLTLLATFTFSEHALGASRRSKRSPRKPVVREVAQRNTVPFESALVEDANTGEVLFEKDPFKKWPPASMTKMMLLLITMEKVRFGSISLNDRVTISRNATNTGGTRIYLREKEVFPLEVLLKAVLMNSANDAARAVAEHVAGSVPQFVDLINQKTAQLKMEDTHFTTVNGLPSKPGTVADITTAHDMAKLARVLINYSEILDWASIRAETVRVGKRTIQLHNVNRLIGFYPGADGLKTGYIRRSKFNLTATAERGGKRLISVVMGAPTNQKRFIETARLLDLGFKLISKGS